MQPSVGLHEDRKTDFKDRNLAFQVARAQQSFKREPCPLSLHHKWSTVPTPTKGLLEGAPELVSPSQCQHQGALRALGTAFLKSAQTVCAAFPVNMSCLRCCYIDHCPGTRCSQLRVFIPQPQNSCPSSPMQDIPGGRTHQGPEEA